MHIEFHAGTLFEMLKAADRPFKKGQSLDMTIIATIDFPTDEEAHNNALQAAVRDFAESLLDLATAHAQLEWGEPDYRLTSEDAEVPAWVDDLERYPVSLVGWRRGKKVAFVYWEQEDREIPVFVYLGVVRWRSGMIEQEQY